MHAAAVPLEPGLGGRLGPAAAPAPGAGTAAALQLCGRRIALAAGGVHRLRWPDAAALRQELLQHVRREAPVLRWAGGALIADLSLHDNLMLEPALRCGPAAAFAPGATPDVLRAELQAVFAAAGCPADCAAWRHTLPARADARALLQVRVGRAWMADPDVLVVDARHWDDAVLSRERFSRSFAAQHPWRVLVWADVAVAGGTP